MLTNKMYKEGLIKPEDIVAGAYFMNGDINDCDILIVNEGFSSASTMMVNANCFYLLGATKGSKDIAKWLSDRGYKSIEAEIVNIGKSQ